jgi:photosystem II CP47 chlorophyll apoprotein
MVLYELSVVDPSDPIFNPLWHQGMFTIPFMTQLGVTSSWAGWSLDLTGLPQAWSYEAVDFGHIIRSGLLLEASILH